jgi:hypothetical protein
MKVELSTGRLVVISETEFERQWLHANFREEMILRCEHYDTDVGRMMLWPEQAEKKEG